MDNEEKIFYKFIENKILLKEFCDEYKKTKDNEKIIIKESEELKLKTFELENEIKKYKELLNSIEKKKCEEIENKNFDYVIKIKKLEKQIDYLNTCLNSEKENCKLNEKELVSLKYEYNKLKTDYEKQEKESFINKIHKTNISNNTDDNQSDQEKGNSNTIHIENKREDTDRRRNLIVLNKIYSDIDKKIEDLKFFLTEITKYRENIENKMKENKLVLDSFLKKITEINLKYETIHSAYKEAEHKNTIHKWKKKKWKTQIEELKRHNKIMLDENEMLKKNIKNVEKEKKDYYELLSKAEKKNILFFQQFYIAARNEKKFDDHQKPIYKINCEKQFQNDNNQIHLENDHTHQTKPDILDFKNKKHVQKCIFLSFDKKKKVCPIYRLNEFNIKTDRKRKHLLFYSDNEKEKKKKRIRINEGKRKKFIISLL